MRELCRLLIVDDEYLVRQGIKHLLNWEKEGFQVIGEAANGKEALELIEQVRPHIVLTDIVMPVMDGEAFTRTVKLRYPEIEVIVLSSFSEFEYVRSTFQSGVADYILKPTLDNNQLLDILRATAAQIPSLKMNEQDSQTQSGPSIDKIVDRLMSGYDALDYEDTIQVYFPHNSFYWLGCDLSRVKFSSEQEAARWKENVIPQIHSYLSAKGFVALHVNAERTVLLFLLNGDEQVANEHKTAEIVRGLSELEQQLSVDPIWILGERCAQFQKLGQMYKQQFKKLMDKTFYFPDTSFLIASEFGALDQAQTEPFNIILFTEQFKRKQYEEALEQLQSHLAAISVQHEMDVFEFKSILVNMIFTMSNLIGQQMNVQSLDEEKYGFFKKIDEARYARDAIQLMNDYIVKLRGVIEESRQQENPIQPLLEYMHNHYMEQLTLAELAKHFHFNPSYLSSYFSAHTQEGFSDYLNKIRMEKAMELLKDPTVTISDISGRVGYSEHSYFCKVFKKYNGLSPSSYRKKMVKSG